jgi:hypothetical protein
MMHLWASVGGGGVVESTTPGFSKRYENLKQNEFPNINAKN